MPERIPLGATIRVPLQAYLASDHISPATGKTIAITISKNGAAYGNPSGGATNATEIASGSYYVDLSATDTGTLGPLFVRGAVATVDDVIAIYHVVAATNGGFTALPAAAADAAGGLIISDLGGLDADAQRADVAAILVDTGTTLDARIPAALVGGRMDSSAGAMAANVLTASALATDAVAEIADGVWDEAIAGHLTAGSTGAALNAAGSAGDPWATALPGAYGAGTAGNIVGNDIPAIRAKSDNLPSDPADESLVIAATDAIMTRLGTPTATVSADIAAVKVVADATLTEIGVAGAGLTNINLPDQTMNITGSITTVTNLPAIPANWITEAGIMAGALDGKGDWNIGKTGYSLTVAPPTATQNATELLDQAAGVEAGLTVREFARLSAAVLFGKASGLDTGPAVYRDTTDTKDRVVATGDPDGNRTTVILDAT